MNTTSLRTQIILPKKLRAEIEKVRGITKESLGGYLRVAAEQRLRREERQQVSLENLAAEVVGSAKQGATKKASVIRWQRAMRKDRR